MKKIGDRFWGKRYDTYFEWSDDKIYCSELVWKIYKRALNLELGEPGRFQDFDLSHPFVKKIIKERYGNNPPLQELVISPDQIFKSKKLKTILVIKKNR